MREKYEEERYVVFCLENKREGEKEMVEKDSKEK